MEKARDGYAHATTEHRDGDIFGWLADPPTDRGLRFADETGTGWTFCPYARLAELARAAAGRLYGAGVRAGDVVPIVCPTSPTFVAAFYGALLLGATPSALAPPTAYGEPEGYAAHLDRVLRLARARVMVAAPEVARVVAGPAARYGCAVLSDLDAADGTFPGQEPGEIAILQFSSGSTGPQRGVRVPHRALRTNISAIRDWLSYDPHDAMVSWLPLHHDMGLVGCLLMPMAAASDVWLMRPEQFVRTPGRWLHPFAASGASTAVTPTFGLAHLIRRIRPADLAGMDLRGWRTLIVGAEPVHAGVLDDLVRLLGPAGFAADAVLPAYGLAEATLAVAGRRHGTALRAVRVAPTSLYPGKPVTLAEGPDGSDVTLVGCGPPLRDVRVDIVGEDGRPVEAGVLGEIELRGGSVAAGYVADEGEGSFDGVIRTGDAGFLLDGELFVVGRLGDSVKRFGRWLFAEDLDRVAAARSPRPRKTVVLLGDLDGRVTAVVAVEGDLGDAAERIGRSVANHAAQVEVQVRSVPAGWIARTTSGKPRRRLMWQRVLEERAGTVHWQSADHRPEGK
ncbi:AMP-binding protein [Plantactinospora sp. CA-294935]|uniref:AMP-binding protein n=1 Tax=Plantactinospora sp. CA-294935 TaxID=3240012 RepID=UPI003D8D6C1D